MQKIVQKIGEIENKKRLVLSGMRKISNVLKKGKIMSLVYWTSDGKRAVKIDC